MIAGSTFGPPGRLDTSAAPVLEAHHRPAEELRVNAFFHQYPVLSLVLVVAAVVAVAFVVWGGIDGRRRERDGVRATGLDDLLRSGQHRR